MSSMHDNSQITKVEEARLIDLVRQGDNNAQNTLARYLLACVTAKATEHAFNGKSPGPWAGEENFEEYLLIGYDALTVLLYKKKLENFQEKCRLKSYFSRILELKIIEHKRKKARERERKEEPLHYVGKRAEEQPVDPKDRTVLMEIEELLGWMLSNYLLLLNYPSDENLVKKCLSLYCLGISQVEISQSLGISLDTVRGIIRRASNHLAYMPGARELKEVLSHCQLDEGDLEKIIAGLLEIQND